MIDWETMGSALWSKRHRLKEAQVSLTIDYWRSRLQITQRVHAERISPYQVTGESGRPGCSLVGVVYDEQTATIYHTRALTGEDIAHELLHVAHPDWSEAQVVAETERQVREAALQSKRPRLLAVCPAV